MLLDAGDRELFGQVWRLAWPTVIYGALELTIGLVDLLMVRPLGPSATAAIGISRQVTFLVETSALAITTGVITLVSQSVGAGALSRANSVVRQSYRLVLFVGLPMGLLGVVAARPLFLAMQAEPSTLAQGVPYLRIYFLGLVFLWANLVGTAAFRGAGNTLTPLKVALGINVVNVVLNYVFIYGVGPAPALGVPGAAIGSVTARTCGAFVLLWLLRPWRTRYDVTVKEKSPSPGDALQMEAGDLKHAPLRAAAKRQEFGIENAEPRTGNLRPGTGNRQILAIGLPVAVAGIVRNGSRVVFIGIVGASASGLAYHAAVGVGLQVRLIGVLPALAFQLAIATLVGQALGRGDLAEAETIGRRGVLLVALLMLGVCGVVFALANPLAHLFIASKSNAQLAATVLRWFAVAQYFSALSITTQGGLVGVGDTKPCMNYTVFCQWIIMLPLAYILLKQFQLDPVGPLIAWTVAPIISLVLMQRRFRSGRWKSRFLISD